MKCECDMFYVTWLMLRTGQISLLKSLSEFSVDIISQSTVEKLTVNTKVKEKNQWNKCWTCAWLTGDIQYIIHKVLYIQCWPGCTPSTSVYNWQLWNCGCSWEQHLRGFSSYFIFLKTQLQWIKICNEQRWVEQTEPSF